jgi:hypothetical protein
MSNPITDHNATPLDDGGTLRGGTQGGDHARLIDPNAEPGAGGTNALSPAGTPRPLGRPPGPIDPEDAGVQRNDPHRATGDGSRRPSPGAAAQQAREDADVPPEVSRSGHDEGNPRQISPDAPHPGKSS